MKFIIIDFSVVIEQNCVAIRISVNRRSAVASRRKNGLTATVTVSQPPVLDFQLCSLYHTFNISAKILYSSEKNCKIWQEFLIIANHEFFVKKLIKFNAFLFKFISNNYERSCLIDK